MYFKIFSRSQRQFQPQRCVLRRLVQLLSRQKNAGRDISLPASGCFAPPAQDFSRALYSICTSSSRVHSR